jgi:class 3 adenylate cyclase/pimeloyl-ACP methyl ester carboxylesterase
MERRLSAILAADIAGYSRLMGEDEEATVDALKGHQQAVLPLIVTHGGRLIDTAGDGILAEFPSVMGAFECATEIQRIVDLRNASVPAVRRMLFRMGINVGDVLRDDARIYGDGINIAARLEGIAEPGGICVTRPVFEQVSRTLDVAFRALGPQRLKNISHPVEVYALLPGNSSKTASPDKALEQVIRFCTASDGAQLAYSIIGAGTPLVKTGNWMTHLEYELESPLRRDLWRNLATDHSVLRYDSRGNGLSDWDAGEISLEAWVSDLETVVDASGIERFSLLGISQGSSIAVAYAVRHPERVSHLVLYGGFVQGPNKRARTASQKEEAAAMIALTRVGWGKENPAFRQLFTSLFAPDATKEQADWFNELQRRSASAECAVRYMQSVGDIDITDLLPQVKAPTLVMHLRDDARVPFESGRKLAAGIPGARFVPLEGRNHFILPNDPASGRFVSEIRQFIAS